MLRKAKEDENKSFPAQGQESTEGFGFKKQSRYRKNVLDLILRFGGKARTSHLFVDINMANVELLRTHMNEEHHHVTVTAVLLKAIAIAQIEFPESRTFYLPNNSLVTYEHIVGGITVEREINGDAIVFFGEVDSPQKKTIWEINGELRSLAHQNIDTVPQLHQQKIFSEMPDLIRSCVLTLAEWLPALRLVCMGATFGMSSLGALGITSAFGPSVCTSVFGVGAVEKRPVVIKDQVSIRPMLSLALSFDQRALDLFQAGRFLNRVKTLLESDLPDFDELSNHAASNN